MWSGAGGSVDRADHTRRLLEQRITTATSVSSFEESDIHSYRTKLRHAFDELIQYSIECFQDESSASNDCSSSLPKARSRHIFNIAEPQRRTNSVNHHDNDAIVISLSGLQTNFSSLCRHHDEFIRRSASTSRRTESTALEEVLYAILDPTIVPYACSGPFIQLLAKAYVEDSNLRLSSTFGNQSHEALLKQTLCAFAHRSPQIDLLMLNSYFRTTLRIETREMNPQKPSILDVIDSYNIDQASQCVELIEFVVKTLPDARFEGSAVCLLIESIGDMDGADILLARPSLNRSARGMNTAKRAPTSCCSRCQVIKDRDALRKTNLSLATAQSSRKRRRSANTASLDLHDETDDDNESEEDSGIAIESLQSIVEEGNPMTQRISLTKRMRHFGDEPKVSLKKIMGSASFSSRNPSDLVANEAGCACLCYTESATSIDSIGSRSQGVGRRCSALPLKMIQLRSDAYRALVSLTKFHFYDNIPRNESINAVIFNKAIQQMRKHPMCAASRVSAVLLADVRGIESGFLPLLDKLLAFSTSAAIRTYSELVVNLAIFDDPVVFWKATQQLLDQALNMSSYCQGYQMTMRRAISYILVERYRTVSSVERFQLQPYITDISEMFGSQDHWIHEPMLQDEKDEIIRTLQTLGILGFIDGNKEMATPDIDASLLSSLCGESFPFLPSSSLRDAVARMGPHVGCNRFLSRLDARITIDLPKDDDEVPIKSKDRTDSFDEGTPILEHLNDDFLIRRIFSFLNHRKLAAVSSVCRVWHQIANEPLLWQRLYRMRFKTLAEIDVLPDSTCSKVKSSYASKENDRDWRKLFDAKWLAERQLRSAFSRDGKWKCRTCIFVGCLAVPKSKASFEKHICKHKKDLAKEIERTEASEERKRKRRSATKKGKEPEK